MDVNAAMGRPHVDRSPTYDLLFSLDALASPAQFPRRREWAEAAVADYTPAERQRLRRWFGASGSLGSAFVALIPRLAPPSSADDLVAEVARLSMADLLRVIVTAGYTRPEAPLDATDLLALVRNAAATRDFMDRYLRLSGQARTQAQRAIADPEGARADLLAVLRRHAASASYQHLLDETADERTRALAALQHLLEDGQDAPPGWLRAGPRPEGFAQVIFAVSAVLGDRRGTYYQEISRPLLDGTEYEPLIITIGTRLALGEAPFPRRGIPPTGSGESEWAAGLFALLADPSRLRLVRLLAARPHYGLELAAALGMSGATVSHHVDLLMKAGLVVIERRAHRTYYVLQVDTLRREIARGAHFILDLNSEDEHAE